MGYHDPFKSYVGPEGRVQEYADAIARVGRVILTDDEATLDANGDVLVFRRSRYIAIYQVTDVSYSAEAGLRLQLTQRLENLKP